MGLRQGGERAERGLDAPFSNEPCLGMMSRVDMTTYLHRLGSRAPFQTTWTHKASISGELLRELGASWDMTDMASFEFFLAFQTEEIWTLYGSLFTITQVSATFFLFLYGGAYLHWSSILYYGGFSDL